MCSLFKRVTVPLLAVAAAAALCAPTRAATATLDYCQADGPKGIDERVECSITNDSEWKHTVYNADLLGGGDDKSITDDPNIWGPGDYYSPSRPYYYVLGVNGGGTYNCWCVCSGADYNNVAWNASTGGTKFVSL